jgi:hypothetical protein
VIPYVGHAQVQVKTIVQAVKQMEHIYIIHQQHYLVHLTAQ